MSDRPEERDIAERDGVDGRAQRSIQALTIFVVVIGFMAAPILKYADLFWATTLAAAGAIAVMLTLVGRGTVWQTIGALAIIPVLIAGAEMLFSAQLEHEANQARCLEVEVDMLSPRPTRSNAPEVFQALGCVPQPSAARAKAPQRKITGPIAPAA